MRKLIVGLVLLSAVLVGSFLGISDRDIPYDVLVETYAAPPSAFAQLENGQVAHYRDRGPRDAPVLLLIHGSNASLFTWEPWAQLLQDRYRVISVDLIGHGLSSLSPDDDYSNAAYENFLEQFVMAMDLDTFTLAGNSMGGAIAWRYALGHADELEALVLVDASGIPRRAEDTGETALVYKLAEVPGLNKLLLHILPRSVVKTQLLDAVGVDAIVTEEMVTRYHAFLLREGRRAATLARMNTPWETSPVERLGEIKTPTLILWGAQDTWVPVHGAHVYDAEIPTSTLILYDGVGHIPMEEVAVKSAADLDDFLTAVRKQRVAAEGTPPALAKTAIPD